jgi:hypothetical protein
MRALPSNAAKFSRSHRGGLDANEYFHHSMQIIREQFYAWAHRIPSAAVAANSQFSAWDDLVTHKPTFMLQLYQTLENQLESMADQPYHSERQSALDSIHTDLTFILSNFFIKSSFAQANSFNFSVANKYLTRATKFAFHHRSSVSLIDQTIELKRFYAKVKLNILQTRYDRDRIIRNNNNSAINTENDNVSNSQMIERLTKSLTQVNEQQSRRATNFDSLDDSIINYRLLRLKASINEDLFELNSLKSNDRAASQNISDADQSLTKLSKIFIHQQLNDNNSVDSSSSLALISSVKLESSGNSVLVRKAAKSFLAAAKFANSRLLALDEADTGIFTKTKSSSSTSSGRRQQAKLSSNEESHFIELFITNVLHGMKLNNRNARAFFPRTLELLPRLANASECRHQFQIMTSGHCDRYGKSNNIGQCHCDKNENIDSNRIPLWMFLQWLPQLMSHMGSKLYSLISPIIEQLAAKYPQAVFFPFHLSSTTIDSEKQKDLDNKNKLILNSSMNKLKSSLSSKLLPKLISAFDSLTYPDHKAKDMWSEIKGALGRKEFEQAVKIYQTFKETQLTPVTASKSSDSKHRGPIAVKFATKYRKKFEEILGPELSDVNRASMINIGALNKRFNTFIETDLARDRDIGSKGNTNNQMTIKVFSPWLVEYRQHSIQAKETIELPGQYDGESEPVIENHIKLESFHPTLLVLASLRKPKKLTMIGSDELEHPYLVKAGEDMRLDQRIEQIFATINSCIKNDSSTKNSQTFQLRTYAALPLTQRLGIVEWMKNTTTVKYLINEIAGRDFTNEAQGAYVSMLKELSHAKPPLEGSALTNDIIEKAPQSKVVSKYEAVAKKTNSENYIVKYLQSLTGSIEAFLTIRTKFAHSFSLLTAVCYTLGIGDRHLDNFLFDKTSGDLIAIDFGAAFGQGVLLTVPELMPVRLTPQLKTVLSPLPTLSLLKTDLIALMTIFHKNSSLLMTIMAVFINEPHIEWNEAAKGKNKRQAKRTDTENAQQSNNNISNSDNQANELEWLPRRKLAIAQSKLHAVNPARIMIEELNDNPSINAKPELKRSCLAIVLGIDRDSHRNKIGEWCASIEEQIDCLIEQSTDPNILGRTWQGWLPSL